jgi:hypothetical protein
MQDELNQRTEAIDDANRGMLPLSPEQQKAYLELSEEQGQLADLLLELSKPATEKPEDDPEKLPELELDQGLESEQGLESNPGLESREEQK